MAEFAEEVRKGAMSIDDARRELGRQPWGLAVTSSPGWEGQWGDLVPLARRPLWWRLRARLARWIAP